MSQRYPTRWIRSVNQQKTDRRARPRLEGLEDRIALTDGALDDSFGPEYGGYTRVSSQTTTTTNIFNSEVRGLVVQPSGKTVIAYQYPGQNEVRLTRFSTDGSIDTSFGTSGTVAVTIGTIATSTSGAKDELRALLVQPNDGKLIIAGNDAAPAAQGGNQFAVARLTVDGALDPTFDVDGRAVVFMGYGARLFAATLQSDGRIVAAGKAAALSTDTSNQDFAVMRLNINGSLDNTFGDPISPGSPFRTGMTRPYMDLYAYGYDEARSVVVMPETQSILLFGYAKKSNVGLGYTAAFARLNPDGSWDTTYGDGGWKYDWNDALAFSGGRDVDSRIPLVVQPVSGRVLLAGTVDEAFPLRGTRGAVFRFLDQGDLDSTFGVNGVARFDVPTNVTPHNVTLNDLTVQRDDSIFVGGSVVVKKDWITNNDSDYFVARLKPTGQLDATFDGDGTSIIPFDWEQAQTNAKQTDYGQMVALQPSDGRVLIAGVFRGPTHWEYGVSRLLATLPPKITTNTTLTASKTTISVGDTVNFSVTVSPASAKGTVELYDGFQFLDFRTLVNGAASFSYSGFGIGSHGVTARFLETATHDGGVSATSTITVLALPSSLNLSLSTTSSAWGTPVTLTALTTPAQATGVVQFFAEGGLLDSVPLNAGRATLSVNQLGVGTSSITARYQGDARYAPADSPARALTINRAASSTNLALSTTSAEFGRLVTFTATITPTKAPGVVVFRDGATVLGQENLINGSASWSSSSLGLGSHSITAEYLGDPNVFGSTSLTAALDIVPATTTLALAAPAQVGYNGTIRLTATATSAAGVVVGKARFEEGGVSLGEADLVNGIATLDLPGQRLAPGAHVVRAVFDGGGGFKASASSTQNITVQQPITTTAQLTSTVGPVVVGLGSTIEFTARIQATSGSPTGVVEFRDGANLLQSIPLQNGVAKFVSSNLSVGAHAIVAKYLGDAFTVPVISAPFLFEIVLPVDTTTSLSVDLAAASAGETVRLTAVVAGSQAPSAGMVAFYDGVRLLGRVNVSNGSANLDVSSLSVGAHSLIAVYEGIERFRTSQSAAVALSVTPAAATVVLSASSTSLTWGVFGPEVTLTATASSLAGAPTGTISFFRGGQLLGTAALVGGEARLTTSGLVLGDNTLTARYEGDASHQASDAAALVVAVRGETTLSLQAPSTVVVGRPIQLSAQVLSASGSPTGVVEFFNGAQSLGTVAVVNGQAVLNVPSLPMGNQSLSARFAPSSSHLVAQSSVVGLTVEDVPGSAIGSINVVRRGTTVLRLELRLNGPLNLASAGRTANYRLTFAGRDRRFGTRDDQVVALASARYTPTSGLVTLTPRGRLNLQSTLRLTALNLTDDRGRPLDGDRDGKPGGSFAAQITRTGWSFGA